MKAMLRRTDNPDLSSKYPLELREMVEGSPTLDHVSDRRPPTLEDKIDIVRGLDLQRRISADLRDHGVKVLQLWIKEEWIKDIPRHPSEASASDKNDLARQMLFAVAAVDVLYRCCKEPTEEIEALLTSLVTYLDQGGPSSAATAADGQAPQPPDSRFLTNLARHDLSVLLAAELMQALVAAPDLAYSKATLLCYYWIIREIYTAAAPDWNIGGARAAPGGKVSAFITSKCVLSIVRFAHAQEQTAFFIDSLCAFEEQRRRLEANNQIPGPYKNEEMKRLAFNCYVALHRYGKTLALPFTKPKSPEPDDIDDYVRKTLDDLKNIVNSVSETFGKAVAEVDKLRPGLEYDNLNSSEKSVQRQEKIRFDRFGHETAESALKEGFEITKEVCKLYEQDHAPDPIEVLTEISKKLKHAYDEVRKTLEQPQNYLSSVLNRELAAVSLGNEST